jgi:hypothetical protein
MAWRPHRYIIEGALDNTQSGKVIGWMRFKGIKARVTLDLDGNFHRDIRGAKIHFKSIPEGTEQEAAKYMTGFAEQQRGKVGDMTAGLEPADYVTGECYLEWFSDKNGRVVIELEQNKVRIIGKPLPASESEPVSRSEHDRLMAEHMQRITKSLWGHEKE